MNYCEEKKKISHLNLYHIVLTLITFTLLLAFSSCTKFKEPQIISFKLDAASINRQGLLIGHEINLTTVLLVTNGNRQAIDFTINNLSVTLNKEPFGKLSNPETYVMKTFSLKPMGVTRLEFDFVIDSEVALKMLLIGHLQGELNLVLGILGDMTVHYRGLSYPYLIERQHKISPADLKGL